MFDWWPAVPPLLELLVLFAAAAAALEGLRRLVWAPLKAFRKKVDAGMDTLLGYPAVIDPGSGSELKPATPPLALRVESLESTIALLVTYQEKVLALHERLVVLEEWHMEHDDWSNTKVQEIYDEIHAWRREHEALHLLTAEVKGTK